MTLREDQVRRYARHVLLPDIGGHGQTRLLEGAVTLHIGPGDAAAVVALAYLAAAGVGHIRLTGAVAEPVTEADLAAGILYRTSDLGRPRFDALSERLAALNSDVTVSRTNDAADVAVMPATEVCDALIQGGLAAVRAAVSIAIPAPSST